MESVLCIRHGGDARDDGHGDAGAQLCSARWPQAGARPHHQQQQQQAPPSSRCLFSPSHYLYGCATRSGSKLIVRAVKNLSFQCCGSGSVCFWASRIRIHNYEVRIRILLSSSKNSKKTRDSYCSVTSL